MLGHKSRTCLVLAVVFATTLLYASSASAALHLKGWGSTVTPLATDEQVVFDYNETLPPSDCRWAQFPDSPPRVFKDSSGQTQMILANTLDDQRELGGGAGGGFNFRLTGPNLDNLSVEPGCHTIYGSGMEKVPDNFNNQEWLTATYTTDGQTIYGLVHNEYHGWEYPNEHMCGTQSTPENPVVLGCWYNAITGVKSTDGGATYQKINSPPNHRVATFPYKYEPDKGPAGYFQPTNIIQKGGYYYAMVRAEPGGVIPGSNPPQRYYPAQTRGDCLLQTQNLADPSSWRAWDGTDFNVRFINPYDPTYNPAVDPPENHLCTPVSPDTGGGQSGFKAGVITDSLTYNTYFGQYMLAGYEQKQDPNNPNNWIKGFYYSLSNDLIHWSERKLIAEVEPPWLHTDCTTPDPVADSAVLDPTSTDRNYGTTGQDNELYYVVFHYSLVNGKCVGGVNRDVVRIPFRFHATPMPNPRWATGWPAGCPGAFDADVYTQAQSSFLSSSDRNYSGFDLSYKADTTLGGPSAYGQFDKKTQPSNPLCEFNNESNRDPLAFGEDDEIRYSGAFVFPTNGFWNNIGSNGQAANVTILRLEGGAPGYSGAIVVTKDGLVRFNGNFGGSVTQYIAGSGTASIPKDNCWHFFDVYQKLSSDPSKAVDSLWIDGQPVQTVTGVANFPANTTAGYKDVRAGIVMRTGASNVFLYTDMAGLGYGIPLSYIGCTGVNDHPPQ